MAFFKSFSCLSGTFYVRRALEVKLKNGLFLNYYKAFNGKRLFRTEPVVKARFRSRRNSFNQESPSFQDILPCQGENQSLPMSVLWKPLIFTLAFSAGSFAGCAIWQYENMRKHAMSIRKGFTHWYPDIVLQRSGKKPSWTEELSKKWNELSEGEKLFIPICVANVLVFLAWRIPKFHRTMVTYFSSHARSSATCWPLILSAFSHYSAIHLGMNMYALNSFTNIGVASLGKEQYLYLYLTGGVISAFISLFVKVIGNNKGLSVGASGAIMTAVGYICSKYPEMELAIVGLPWFSFTAGSALKALLAFDLTGMVLGWKLLDHAAHLGGAFFGVFWYYYGNCYIWHKKDTPLQWWHKFRSSVQ